MAHSVRIFTFVVIVSIAGCNSESLPATPENLAMQEVLIRDQELGEVRNAAAMDVPISEAVRDYLKALDQIDFARCPDRFVDAFRAHRDAWEATLPVLENFSEERGDLHKLFQEFKRDPERGAELQKLDKQIWKTWAEVEDSVYQR